jgi:hypothetical protein
MSQEEEYARMLATAKKDRREVSRATRVSPLVYIALAILLLAIVFAGYGLIERDSARSERAGASDERARADAYFNSLKAAEKTLALDGFLYGMDGSSAYVEFRKPGIQVYADHCNGYPCARFYMERAQ